MAENEFNNLSSFHDFKNMINADSRTEIKTEIIKKFHLEQFSHYKNFLNNTQIQMDPKLNENIEHSSIKQELLNIPPNKSLIRFKNKSEIEDKNERKELNLNKENQFSKTVDCIPANLVESSVNPILLNSGINTTRSLPNYQEELIQKCNSLTEEDIKEFCNQKKGTSPKQILINIGMSFSGLLQLCDYYDHRLPKTWEIVKVKMSDTNTTINKCKNIPNKIFSSSFNHGKYD